MHSVNDPLGFAYTFLTVTFRSRFSQGSSCMTQEMVGDSKYRHHLQPAVAETAWCYHSWPAASRPPVLRMSPCDDGSRTPCLPELGKSGLWCKHSQTWHPKCRCLFSEKSKGYTLFSWCAETQRPRVMLLTAVRCSV